MNNLATKATLTERIATFIKEKRLALGLSQREFSELIFDDGKKKDWICRIESGKPITLTTLERILKKINADINIIEF